MYTHHHHHHLLLSLACALPLVTASTPPNQSLCMTSSSPLPRQFARLSKILPARESHDITTRVGSSYGGNHSLQWIEEPRNLLVVTKRCDEEVDEKLRGLVR